MQRTMMGIVCVLAFVLVVVGVRFLLGLHRRGGLMMVIVAARREEPVDTTDRLRGIVEGVLPRGVKSQPVLSRVFQALRIAVNAELEALDETLEIRVMPSDAPGPSASVMSSASLLRMSLRITIS